MHFCLLLGSTGAGGGAFDGAGGGWDELRLLPLGAGTMGSYLQCF